MNVAILYRRPMRDWQARLAVALRTEGHRVTFVAGQTSKASPFSLTLALRLQRRLFGPASSRFDVVANADENVNAESAPDLVMALDGELTSAVPRLEALWDGEPGDAGLIRALTLGGSPTFRARLTTDAGSSDLVTAVLAVEDRDVLSRAIDQTLARVGTLMVQAVRRYGRGAIAPASIIGADDLRRSSPFWCLVRRSIGRLVGRSFRTRQVAEHWRVAYRRAAAVSLAEADWTSPPFITLVDDGQRFHADPVPIEHEGRNYVFFEDYIYAAGKGTISVVTIEADGSASQPKTVLDLPVHLSYPFIIRHNENFYMLPEMGAARRVQLFRADRFPDRWVADKTLLDDCVAADSTPIFHDGRWWLFATLSDDGGSTWDQLCLYHAPDLLGPWQPHADNPVLVDASAARPAGAMWHENGVLMRVVQDCRKGYGRGLAVCRVDHLDSEIYAQTVLRRFGPPPSSGADGIHSFNRDGAVEVIDLRYPRR